MSNNDIWSGLTTSEKMTNHRNGIVYHTVNRNNLNIYMNSHSIENINDNSLTEFFSIDNLSKFDEATGWYLSHLLFYRKFDEEKLKKMLDLVFKYVSIYQGTEKEGYSYLHTLFMQNNPYSDDFIFYVVDQAKQLGFDFTHQAFDGSTFLHWVILYTAYTGLIDDLTERLPNGISEIKDEQNFSATEVIYILRYFLIYKNQQATLNSNNTQKKQRLIKLSYLNNSLSIYNEDTLYICVKNTPLYKYFFQYNLWDFEKLRIKNMLCMFSDLENYIWKKNDNHVEKAYHRYKEYGLPISTYEPKIYRKIYETEK